MQRQPPGFSKIFWRAPHVLVGAMMIPMGFSPNEPYVSHTPRSLFKLWVINCRMDWGASLSLCLLTSLHRPKIPSSPPHPVAAPVRPWLRAPLVFDLLVLVERCISIRAIGCMLYSREKLSMWRYKICTYTVGVLLHTYIHTHITCANILP
jgi:hypothetical protein